MTDTITVTGNIANDPEQRQIGSGATVTSFRVASTHRRLDRETKQWVDAYTNWYAVSAFRALGEHAFASLRRGDRVIVTGRLRLREWDNGTRKGTTAEIDADAVGHDLLWGVTTFQKANAESRRPAGPEATPAVATSTDADGWAIPVAEPEPERATAVEVPF